MDFVHKEIKITGYSVGGIETSFILPHFKMAFDFGRGSEELIDVPRVFLSHGHLDHSSGIAYYFSQRALKNLPPGEAYVPAKIAKPLKKINDLWKKIEGFSGAGSIIPLSPNEIVPIQENYFLRAVESYHRIPSLGYIIYKKSQKLKQQYQNLAGHQIKKLKEKNEPIFTIVDIPILAFSGDTSIEFLDKNPDVARAKVLIFETTYIDEKRTVERARQWGHTHLEEIIERLPAMENEKIILTHLSKRYQEKYFVKVAQNRIPPAEQSRFVIWNKDRPYFL